MGTLNRAATLATALAAGLLSAIDHQMAMTYVHGDNLNWIPRGNRRSGAAAAKRAAKKRNNIRKHARG